MTRRRLILTHLDESAKILHGSLVMPMVAVR